MRRAVVASEVGGAFLHDFLGSVHTLHTRLYRKVETIDKDMYQGGKSPTIRLDC